MAALSAIFLGIIFFIGLAVVLTPVTLVAFLADLRHRWRWIGITALFYCVAVYAACQWAVRPSILFEREFGFAPTPDVRFISSTYWVLGDSGHLTLVFHASPQTIERIRIQEFELISEDDGAKHFHKSYERSFASETADLVITPAKNRVFYEWTGIA
ncbi:hypothetical protein [Planctomicrobium piriforme]|uniref:Uncharacterized protein n=1 Tax=Planctomicrobium piriforme TaxID=1576369 RepID=A0A1I3SNK1_9PLAN|nr:hypothetical protein [Planctomicrobium piriforme]SFJ60414.1 hypothetical protein SAMN05421753_12522 [Planctomicrobium piriforme]